jgi:hypothetical protein
MSDNNTQNEFPMPDGSNQKRSSARHLPKYFRTEKNKKFLQSTLDQLLQPGVAEKVNSFVGKKTAKSFTPSDNYLDEISSARENYQLEPVSVIKDALGNVDYYSDYRDFINQIGNFNGINSNHGRNTKEEFYAWDPQIDWDKFSNFREYYWLPNGPQTVVIPGDKKEITSTYTVSLKEALGDYSYIFTPDGLTNNPSLKLYRGVVYRFEIETTGSPLTFRTQRSLDNQFLLKDEVSQQSVESGVIELILGPDAPSEIFYVADNDINMGGIIKVANQNEATTIDVASEIIGKKYYTTKDGWSLTNGLKVRFEGDITPSVYAETEWYVEGVGSSIQLISDLDVEVSFPVGIDLEIPFDDEDGGFDNLPFSLAIGYPRDKDYITINRASRDGNFWSRYNRWFHKSVIDLSAEITKTSIIIDQSQRANRPIIEFVSGLKLYNFGTKNKQVIDVVDDYTTDAFSIIEGSLGYNIDGIQLTEGMRVLFLNDSDPLVNGKIFQVNFIQFTGSGSGGQISLTETFDAVPIAGENVLVVRGSSWGGKVWYFDGTTWNLAQEKTSVNQPPIFDIFDSSNVSYSNTASYPASSFRGTKLFSYKEGIGTSDSVLGFPLSYRSIDNVGDIVFNFDYNADVFQYQINDQILTKSVKDGFLRKYNNINQYTMVGTYTKANQLSEQRVILQYINDNSRSVYPINCFDQSAYLTDLSLLVYINSVYQTEGIDYELVSSADKFKNVKFLKEVPSNASIIFKCSSSTAKNNNGYYEIANNLEKNPLNDEIASFTLGEVSDHVSSITENLEEFVGVFPGTSNLRDISNQSKFGKKFIKHSSPLNLSMYSLLDNDSNLIKSLRYSKKEYSKFKRNFLQTAETLGFEGPVKQHVDAILTNITSDKTLSMPFYFSDMLAFGPPITTKTTVEDIAAQFFALTTPFTLDTLSSRAVTVYINSVQLLHNKDYVFNNDGFLRITAPKQFGDIIEINEYETTNGSYIPPTPSKLGLYPTWEPELYEDTSYGAPVNMIKGHDGSLVKAFNDYRDDLILELEKRIFNNIKIKYDNSIHNIHSYLPGLNRNTAFTKLEVYAPMTADFIQWLALVDEDYTANTFFDRTNTFTFNYASLRDKNGNKLSGWWRGIYKYYFDTERPNTHPWEMLGFTIKPTWFEEVYGPAPYTRNNAILWEDLEAGIIREPNVGFKIDKRYSRPGLRTFIPVDASGNLLGPSDCNIPKRFESINLDQGFVFGDNSPVESAWASSSDYPFALLTSWAINSPASLLATGFDRSRQIKNILDQIVYKPTMTHIRLEDIVFPNTYIDTQEVLSSGLINYISNYMASSLSNNYEKYKTNLISIENTLGFKLGGFTDKSKFKLILDSRTPLNNSNVFVPEENYQIILNTSFPIKTINYSGVIIELSPSGFIIRGYDNESPAFKYYATISSARDVVTNVAGVSEQFVDWAANKTYAKDLIIRFNQSYYRTKITYTSTNDFADTNLTKLSTLPVTGGIDAIFKRKFNNLDEKLLPYGTVLRSIQDVVDFLLGYEAWLVAQGFRFEYFDGTDNIISDWKNASREFMFWTAQNWSTGAVIALSPAADQVYVQTEYAVVDDVFDGFYGYGLIRSDGRKLSDEFVKISRQEKNIFKLEPKTTTADGIYAIRIPIVQKEHVVLIDNTSVFGDVIYQPTTGYRQERIKTFGYRTTEWDGSLNIPGFLYSEIVVKNWEQWKDYSIGDIVKHKEFYYSADKTVSGKETFDYSEWIKTNTAPESGLITNFEYKVNQFADFYDLDTDNFDVNQQQLAQHLIGYQKRSYLENIINDEVSQYKFYQGMIQEKGTRNSLDKLFDVLSANDLESLDFYEEWAIKQGQYGASEGFDEVEFRLDEKKFRLNPQPFILTNTDSNENDLVYRIKDYEVFKKPTNYTQNTFPLETNYIQYTRSPGFVNTDDVNFVLPNYISILDLDIQTLNNNDYLWIGNKGLKWDVLQYQIVDTNIIKIETLSSLVVNNGSPYQVEIVLNSAPSNIQVGNIIGISNLVVFENEPVDSSQYITTRQTPLPLEGFFEVVKTDVNKIYVNSSTQITLIPECLGLVTNFKSVKALDLADANKLAQEGLQQDSLLWIENDNESWKVIKNNQAYNLLQLQSAEDTGQDNDFGKSIAVDDRNTLMSVGSPGANTSGKTYVYSRGGNNQNYQFVQTIDPITGISDPGERFGESQVFSKDGKYLLIGAPEGQNVKTRFKGEFDPVADYQNKDIVQYADRLWEVVVDVQGANEEAAFGSFTSIIEVIQENEIFEGEETFSNLLMGNYPYKNVDTDHILVRAGYDQYIATAPGDIVYLDWYLKTTANQTLNWNLTTDSIGQVRPVLQERQPFDGNIPAVNETFLESGLVIQKKVDVVLYIETVSTIPSIGDQIDSDNVFGYVTYVYNDTELGNATIYVERTSGQWAATGTLFLETGELIGEYALQAPVENFDTSNTLGGYWYFDIGSTVTVGIVNADEGRALSVYNVIPVGKDDVGGAGGNIYDLNNTITTIGDNSINSYIRTLVYQGLPGPAGNLEVIPSDLFVVRAPKDLTDKLVVGDTVGLEVLRLPSFSNGTVGDLTVTGLAYTDTNKKHELVGLWDGYIDFDLDEIDQNQNIGQPLEPRLGQFVRERLKKDDGSAGSQTGAVAKISFYQKFNNSKARIYVTNVTGSWSTTGTNRLLEMVGDPTETNVIYRADTVLGDINATALGSVALGIGKLCVFRLAVELEELPALSTVTALEYLIYKDSEILGIATQPNIPSTNNFDYTQVFKVPADRDGTSYVGPLGETLGNYGYFTIYQRQGVSTFNIVDTLVVPELTENLRIGSKLKIAKRNDLYKAFIGCAGEGTVENPGRIYFVNNGIDEEGVEYNWEIAKDKRYKGKFTVDRPYFLDEYVYHEGYFYKALTNIAGDGITSFVATEWELILNDKIRSLDYLGYIPNNTNILPEDFDYKGFFTTESNYIVDEIVQYANGNFYKAMRNIQIGYLGFIDNNGVIEVPVEDWILIDFTLGGDQSLKLDSTNLIKFGNSFDVSDNGEVLVVTASYLDGTTKVVVYRNINDNYQKSQEIVSPLVNDTNIDFGSIVSISQDGKLIAIGAPGADDSTNGNDVGAVFVYKQIGSTFELIQTLRSTTPIRGEDFGKNLEFDGRTLYVSAYNAASDDVTTFDNAGTVFDNQFTSFVNRIANNGVVYVYDRIDDSLVFGQTIDYHTYATRDNIAESDTFGRNITAKNNHLYVSIPQYKNKDNKLGLVLDYRRPDNSRVWNIHREHSAPANLEKIKKVMLYDLDKNVVLEQLDYIDPVQGKIAGPADEEIRYKSTIDPAIYSTGISPTVNVNQTGNWGQQQIGQVWWDLTNAKFINAYQGNTIYKTNSFNALYPGASIDVYEWVESKYPPREWDRLTTTADGKALGVSGTTKYGADVFSQRREYDSIAKSFTNYYYYWVKNKTSIPDLQGRTISVDTVAKLIEDPAGQKYKFIAILDSSSFALYNCNSLIKDNNTVLNIQYWTYSDRYSNIHNRYQILTEGLSTPYTDIVQKMFDSLIGYDIQSRPVPDPNLSVRERYGILNRPRQSWFINKSEALKQVIERVNIIFKDNLLTDERDIAALSAFEEAPSLITRKYDTSVDALIDLQFVGVANTLTASLTPIVEDGKIVRVDISNPGRNYKTVPTYTIQGQGSGAEFEIAINSLGQIIEVNVLDGGINYNSNTTIKVRSFTVLVNADESISGKWALYERSSNNWLRIGTQSYNVNTYWEYIDWYDTGYNEFTEIDHVIDFSYALQGLNSSYGDIVKILNIGGEGWLLLEKIDDQITTDYTVNYKTIGKQDGTIKFKENLYSFDNSSIGFDNQTFDTQFFDLQPVEETRRILNALKDDIFTGDLQSKFNDIFFVCLRYVFSEQGYVDWAFKTSFVRAQHNVGNLSQRVNFKNDNLSSYEEYIEEVKPYKTKIREYVSNYSQLEPISNIITDFDSPPRYDSVTQKITSNDVKVVNGVLFGTGLTTPIDQKWLANLSYEIIRIEISNPGQGYTSAPSIEIEGNATGAVSLGPNGIISYAVVTFAGNGYFSTPKITINGSLREGGTPAVLTAVIGNSPVRSMHTTVKFDRVSGAFFITELNETETYTATGSQLNFNLRWPMDMRTNTVEVLVNGDLILNSNYSYDNYNNRSQGYDKYYGRIEFIDPPANEATVTVNYKKSVNLLDAQDRINLFYNPTSGQIGKDISQLMDGVDYGGVEVKSFNFTGPTGWDSDSWYEGSWDLFDDTYEDETFTTDGSTLVFNLAKPLEKNVKYNIYLNNIRIDDDSYDGTTTSANPYAIMEPIVGDGITDTFTIVNENSYRQLIETLSSSGENNPPLETLTIRKASSDGSLKVSEENFDTAITGGDLAYTTATGIAAEEIVIDGDGFVTTTTSKGPEEVVPGQLMDTLDITVYEKPSSGSGNIQVNNYKGNGVTSTFNLVQRPFSNNNVMVKVNYVILDPIDYRIDYGTNSVALYNIPNVGDNISVISSGLGATNLLDYGELITDGSTQLYNTPVPYSEDYRAYVTVNGNDLPFELVNNENFISIKFAETPVSNNLIQFGVFNSEIDTFSQVSVDELIADGSTIAYELSRAPFAQQPTSYYTIVTVNNNRVLTAGYSEVFTVQSNVLEYKLKLWQIPVGTREGTEIKVFLNGRELEFLQEWTYEGAGSFNSNITADAQAGSTVILNSGIASAGDELKVFVISSGEYRFGYYDSENRFVDTSGALLPASFTLDITDGVITAVNVVSGGRGYNAQSSIGALSDTGTGAIFELTVDDIGTIYSIDVINGGIGYDEATVLSVEILTLPARIYFDETFNPGDVIKVYQYSNHDGLGIERENYDIIERTQMTLDSKGYYDYRTLKNGLLSLRKEAVNINFVWISLNGKWLTPTADYVLLENKKTVKFITTLNEFDVIDIVHFASPPITTRFGWRQFKDMLNKTTYLRLSSEDEHYLAEPLRWYDRTITVTDGYDRLPTPEINSKTPGVLFINGERIEYLRREGNLLKQLRRGTSGTGIKNEYPAGTQFYNQSIDSVIPYKDTEERVIANSGKYTDMSTLYPTDSLDITVDSITYSFNNNTAFPVRVTGVYEQIATLTGTGFRPEVQVIMQDENGEARTLEKVSSTTTEIQFYTESMPVGAYDIVIYNPREESPALRAESSLVVPKLLPYVQILLPFEPEAFTDVVQNPAETGDWYQAPFNEGGIPDAYRQALNIEVFANGKRLRKSSTKVYDVTLGQYSPDGDTDEQAEYAVNINEGAYVRLTTPPEPETTLIIVRKLGIDWREVETTSPLTFKSLGNSNTDVANFLRGKTINLPR